MTHRPQRHIWTIHSSGHHCQEEETHDWTGEKMCDLHSLCCSSDGLNTYLPSLTHILTAIERLLLPMKLSLYLLFQTLVLFLSYFLLLCISFFLFLFVTLFLILLPPFLNFCCDSFFLCVNSNILILYFPLFCSAQSLSCSSLNANTDRFSFRLGMKNHSISFSILSCYFQGSTCWINALCRVT